MTQGQHLQRLRALIGYSYILILTAFFAGCGGGDEPSTPGRALSDTELAALQLKAIPGRIMVVEAGPNAVWPNVVLDNSSAGNATPDQPVEYLWSFTYKPATSKVLLTDATTKIPNFTPDVVGTYILQFTVTSNGITSKRAIVTVEVVEAGGITTGLALHAVRRSSHCVSCHDEETEDFKAKPNLTKASLHISTSNMCEACHSTLTFTPVPFVDHDEIFSNCSSCHDGVQAVGKSAQHVETTAECSDCHNTTNFLLLDENGKYSHVDVYKGCDVCHNNIVAIGKASAVPTHVDTTSDCYQCHTTAAFTPARNHGDLTNGCSVCHGANADPQVAATGVSVDHPIIAQDAGGVDIYDCNYCHNTTTFTLPLPLGFNHSVVDYSVQSCESCHNADVAPAAIPEPATVQSGAPHPSLRDINTGALLYDCGMCHSAPVFAPNPANRYTFRTPLPYLNHATEPDVLNNTCASCHDGNGPGLAVSGLSVNHMPTALDCGECHTPGTFTSGVYDHLSGVVVDNCSTCHNEIISVGKNINHIATTQECDVCHSNVEPITTFLGASFHLNNVPTTCDNCHNGVQSTGLSRNHLPVESGQDCGLCHTVPVANSTFKGGVYHDNVSVPATRACADCHNNVIANDKSVPHIPSLDNCESCHATPPAQALFKPATFDHIQEGIGFSRGGCEGCHTGVFETATSAVFGKDTLTHIPTDQDCNVCHTSFTAFSDYTFTHDNVIGNCVSCHNGNYTVNGITVRGVTATPPHPDPAITGDCGLCHTFDLSDYAGKDINGTDIFTGVFTSNFSHIFVDHTTAAVTAITCQTCHNGNPIKGVNAGHVPTTGFDCSDCHTAGGTFANAVFDHTNIVVRCDTCHNGINATGILDGPSGVHNPNPIPADPSDPAGNPFDCVACHNTVLFAGAKFNHQNIDNNCAICHDGIAATGKPSRHVPTIEDCSVCHVITGFIPATFDHVGIVDNCSSCHDGTFAIGKSQTHVVTNSDCGICHSTNAFIPATFDHSIANVPAGTRCDSCHGVTATGLSTNHIPVPTTSDCGDCHTTTTFVGASWVHGPETARNCTNCHSPAGGATPQPSSPGHFDTNQQCDDCHVTRAWVPANLYKHTANVNYPANHAERNVRCVLCHTNNSEAVTYRTPQYQPFCAGCHAGDFEAEGDHIGGRGGTIEQNKNCGASGCHRIGGRGF